MAILEEPIKELLKLKNYINGEWVESETAQILDVLNPATQKTIARVPMSTREEVNAAVKAAKEAFPDWRRTPPLARARCLFRLKELMEENFERLSRIQTMEHGKTPLALTSMSFISLWVFSATLRHLTSPLWYRSGFPHLLWLRAIPLLLNHRRETRLARCSWQSW